MISKLTRFYRTSSKEDSPVKVAQYYTKLPDKKLLSEKLQRAIAIAKEYQRNKEIGDGEPAEK